MSTADLGTGVYRITGDGSGAVTAANQANAALQTLEQAVTHNWWGIQNLGRAFMALPAAVAVGVAAAIKAASDWETAMASVEKTTYDTSLSVDENRKNLAALEAQLKEIAKTKPVPSVEIAGIAESAGALGVARNDIASFTSVVSDLAATTDLTADAASTNLARLAALTGVTGAGYKNLASAILEAGRSTAATEQQIVGVAGRIAGAAKTFGITADEIVGISAAMATVGVRQELAGTNFQKTLIDIDQAIANNGSELRTWAALTGQTTEEFAASFRENAAGTFAQIVEGLARVQSEGKNFNATLASVGITESRQIQLLSLLAGAQNSTANENVKLTNIMGLTTRAFRDGNTITDIANRRYQTFGSQVQLAKNQLFLFGAEIGKALLPIMKALVSFLSFVVRQFSELPGPVKAVLGAFIGLGAVMSAFIAILLLTIPRIVIAAGAFRQLWTAAMQALQAQNAYNASTITGAQASANSVRALEVQQASLTEMLIILGDVAAGLDATSAAEGRLAVQAAATTANLEAQSAALAATSATTVTNLEATGAAGVAAGAGLTTASGGASRLSLVLGGLSKSVGYIGLAIAGISIVSSIFGKQSNDNAAALERQEKAVDKLVDAYAKGDAAAAKTIANWIRLRIEEGRLADSAKRLGISRQELQSVIGGTASASDYREFIKKVNEGDKKGVDGAREFGLEVAKLAKQMSASKDEALMLGADYNFVATNGKKGAAAVRDLNEALQDSAETARTKATAYLDYTDALFAAQAAAFDVSDAEKAIDEARAQQGENARAVKKAELDLASARLTASQSVLDVQDAEQALASARLEQSQAISKAEDSLADARDSHADALDSVIAKEEALQELKTADYTERITKAELDLRDALKQVRDANQAVQDAQWQLNHLREEGAGRRDIIEAENNLSDARLDAAQAADKLGDAGKELEKLKDPAERAKLIAKAERELASARRDVISTAQAVQTAELNLRQTREDVALNEPVRRAEADLAQSRLDQRGNTLAVADAERALGDARREANSDEIAKAQLEYEQSLYRQAQAMAELKKQQALMRGEEVDAKAEADNLAAALAVVAESLPENSPTKQRIQEIIDLLKKVPEIPKIDEQIAGEDTGTLPQIPSFQGQNPFSGLETAANDTGMWERVKTAILDNMGLIGAAAGWLLGPTIIGAVTGGATAGAWAGPVGAIIGALVGLLVAFLVKNGPKIAKALFGFIKNIPKYLGQLAKAIGKLLAKLPGALGFATGFLIGIVARAIAVVIKGVAGLAVLFGKAIKAIWEGAFKLGHTIFSKAFWDMIWRGLNAAWDKLTSKSTWIGLKDAILSGLGDAAGWLVGIGGDIIKGLWDGFAKAFPEGAAWLKEQWNKIVQSIKDFFGIASPSKLMMQIGGWIIEGLWNGITTTFEKIWNFFRELPGKLWNFFTSAVTWLLQAGKDIGTGLWNGLKNLWDTITGWLWSLGDLAVSAIKTAFGMIGDAGGKLLTLGKEVMGKFWDGIKEIWNSIVRWFSDKVREIITEIAKLWNNTLGKIKFTTPDWLPLGLGGKTFAFPTIDIPDEPRTPEDITEDMRDQPHTGNPTYEHPAGPPRPDGTYPGEPPRRGKSLVGIDTAGSTMQVTLDQMAVALTSISTDTSLIAGYLQEALQTINPDAIAENLEGFGVDKYDLGAFLPQPTSRTLLPSLPTSGSGTGGTTTIVHEGDTIEGDTLQLEAHTDATPGQIFGEFRWHQGLRLRGKTRN